MPSKPVGPTIKVKGKSYDINKDFTWRELLTVEELAGLPLGSSGALDSMAVVGAFVFVVMKRDEPALMWEGFLDGGPDDIEDPEEEKPARARPTRAKASA
jgi:hypothetical protein